MLCLQGSRADHGEAADSQVGLIVPFALFNLFFRLFIEWHFCNISKGFSCFLIYLSMFFKTRKDSVNVLCRTKVIPEPFDHAVLSRRLPGEKKERKVGFFVDCC